MTENVPDGMAAIRARAAARTTGLLDFIEHGNHPIVPAPRAAVGVALVEKVAVAEDQTDTDDAEDDTVPLRVLLDAAAEAMAGRPAEALRAMFGMVASITYKTGRRDGYLTRMRDEHGLPDQTNAAKPSAATGCPDWCAVHHVDPPDTVCHFTAETTVGRVPVWASRVVTDGQTVEELVSVGGETMTTATARTLASVIVAVAGRLDGAR